jgi:hypothetical protein
MTFELHNSFWLAAVLGIAGGLVAKAGLFLLTDVITTSLALAIKCPPGSGKCPLGTKFPSVENHCFKRRHDLGVLFTPVVPNVVSWSLVIVIAIY